jgi:hypothetical protein
MSVRWGLGMFRLWVVISLLWLTCFGAFVVIDLRQNPVPMDPSICKEIETGPTAIAVCEKNQATGIEEAWSRRENEAVGLVVPPLILMVLGLAFRWVLLGFRSQPAAGASRQR